MIEEILMEACGPAKRFAKAWSRNRLMKTHGKFAATLPSGGAKRVNARRKVSTGSRSQTIILNLALFKESINFK